MPDYEDQPLLSSKVSQRGLFDHAGNVLASAGIVSTTSEGAAAGMLYEYARYGLLNPTFALSPRRPDADIDENNRLPHWTGLVTSAGSAITARWEADTGPSGGVLRLTLHGAGSASDDAYLEQIMPVMTSATRDASSYPQVAVYCPAAALGTAGLAEVYSRATFLKADGTTTGSGQSHSVTLTTVNAQSTNRFRLLATPNTYGIAPTDAAFVRLRIGLKRATAATTAAGSVVITSAYQLRGAVQAFLTDRVDPATYGHTTLYQNSGILWLLPGQGGSSGQVVIQPSDYSQFNGNSVKLNSALLFDGVISPSQLTGNTDDWAPTDLAKRSFVRISSDGAYNLTGISAQLAGHTLRLCNVGSFAITLVHDATSTAANRFYCPGGANVTLRPNGWVYLIYDGTSSRWRVSGEAGYQEGTWTPGLSFATPGNLNVAYSTQIGRYVRQGSLVWVGWTIVTSTFTHSTASGEARLTGFPFNAEAPASAAPRLPCLIRGHTGTFIAYGVSLLNSATDHRLIGFTQTASTVFGTTELPTGSTIEVTGSATYQLQ